MRLVHLLANPNTQRRSTVEKGGPRPAPSVDRKSVPQEPVTRHHGEYPAACQREPANSPKKEQP